MMVRFGLSDVPKLGEIINPNDPKHRYEITQDNVDISAGAHVDCAYYTDVHSYHSNWGADFPGINNGRVYQNVNFNPLITEFNHIKAQSLKDKDDDEIRNMQTRGDLEDLDIFSGSTNSGYTAAGKYNGRSMTIHGNVFGESYSGDYSGCIGDKLNNTVFNQAMGKVGDYANMTGLENKDESTRFNTYWDIAMQKRYTQSGYDTNEYAFSMMTSMIEARRRYLGAMTEIFGDTTYIKDDTKMIEQMDKWINDETRGGNLNAHTAGMYMMFFQGQIEMHRQLYPFFGDAADGGYRHSDGWCGPRIAAFKQWMVDGAKDYAGYGTLSMDVVNRTGSTGTGELGIDITQFAGQDTATADAMKAKVNEIIGFMKTIETADRQAEIDRVKALPLSTHQNDDAIKNIHRKNIANEVKNILWNCIERSGDQKQWAVKDMFAKDAGGTNMSTAVSNSLKSILTKMN
ncbi:MAG: hypothetical protein ABIH39_03935 [Candidatus Margulisiibacteriota bacterium]